MFTFSNTHFHMLLMCLFVFYLPSEFIFAQNRETQLAPPTLNHMFKHVDTSGVAPRCEKVAVSRTCNGKKQIWIHAKVRTRGGMSAELLDRRSTRRQELFQVFGLARVPQTERRRRAPPHEPRGNVRHGTNQGNCHCLRPKWRVFVRFQKRRSTL